MKLIQYHQPGEGKRVGVVTRENVVIDVTTDECPTVLSLLETSAREQVSLNILVGEMQERASQGRPVVAPWERDSVPSLRYEDLDNAPSPEERHLLLPLDPPEVWGCGVTYKRSSDMRDEDSQTNIYSRVYSADRPEIFFKATASRCVGHHGAIGIRSDSVLTATEPELAFVLGADGDIVGYTLCNDVSAWDIERDNPLYLPQSKTYNGCCALGPALITPSEVDDIYDIGLTCTIIRDGSTLWEGSVNTGQIKRKFDELTTYLLRDNDCPVGTVVSSGTGIIVPNTLPLKGGDTVKIAAPSIGVLSNGVVQF
ncbi:2-keto-3-deoxy-D-arabinonate dehydratase [Candidatus Poribacteria bacterium]|nr:2-keto-3-deoxy-D-arabinonate dehydratase [Candidatus Poribacteria bacterium]